MKKIISIVLSVLMCAAVLSGCNLFETDYEKDFQREAAVIKFDKAQTFSVEYDVLDEFGEPKHVEITHQNGWVERTDEIEKRRVEYSYVPKNITVYKSQLMNYVNNYFQDLINELGYVASNGLNEKQLRNIVNEALNKLVSSELLMLEADKMMYGSATYYTEEDIEYVMRSVYATIDSEILLAKNEILDKRGLGQIEKPAEGEEVPQPTYPEMPNYEDDIEESPRYHSGTPEENALKGYTWFDEWYFKADWYIEDESKYAASYPGLYGTDRDTSLGREAMNVFLAQIYENSELIIGLTNAEKKTIREEVKKLKKIQNTEGPSYVYPILGKTLLMKKLVGDSYLKSIKASKLEAYISKGATSVSDYQVERMYNEILEQQKKDFADPAKYRAAIDANELILYTPNSNYIFVKHILLPFTKEIQEVTLPALKTEHGKNEQAYIDRRLEMAKNIVVYPHVNGEDDLNNPKTVSQVMGEIKSTMSRYKNSPRDAERAFDEFIYKYNTDPGIFSNQKGYAVVYKPNDIDKDTFMPEFSQGARVFRDEGYKIGQILTGFKQTDDTEATDYVVTDYGIHVMYYASDPKTYEEKALKHYTTPGRYITVYKTLESKVFEKLQGNTIYAEWEAEYLKTTKDKNVNLITKTTKKYAKELDKELNG